MRKLHAALDLYTWLVAEDAKFRMLNTSMPSITSEQLEELILLRPSDREALQQIFARRNDAVRFLDASGPFHIVIGAFGTSAGASQALEQAVGVIRPTTLRPYLNVVVNQDGLYLATISSFATSKSAEEVMAELGLSKSFAGIYVSQSKGWQLWCRARLASCTGGALTPLQTRSFPVSLPSVTVAPPAAQGGAGATGPAPAGGIASLPPGSGAASSVSQPTPRPGDVAGVLLSIHNRHRSEAGVRPLQWDPSLAAAAADYGEVLTNSNRLVHSPADTRPGQGENLWMGTHGAYSVEEMGTAWASERRLFRAGTFPDVSTSAGAMSPIIPR